jgi:hypothetical protein
MTMIVALMDAFSLDFLSSTSMLPKRAWRYKNTLSLNVSYSPPTQTLRITLGRVAHCEPNLVVISEGIENTLFSLSDSDIGESDLSAWLDTP